ncbi:hypothetical protein EVAR_12232_1 [Eumeta japonica]|uniref:Uncharacterized protein n=1 Tax=Eumeta variegata TaxID=151549 RepID=A0A4C1UIF5_EUMVA|nr:hypothetical protein EVAR_12232_1 [Eumeta japonica]
MAKSGADRLDCALSEAKSGLICLEGNKPFGRFVRDASQAERSGQSCLSIARSALSLARSTQAERDNEPWFFMHAVGVHRFIRRYHVIQMPISHNGDTRANKNANQRGAGGHRCRQTLTTIEESHQFAAVFLEGYKMSDGRKSHQSVINLLGMNRMPDGGRVGPWRKAGHRKLHSLAEMQHRKLLLQAHSRTRVLFEKPRWGYNLTDSKLSVPTFGRFNVCKLAFKSARSRSTERLRDVNIRDRRLNLSAETRSSAPESLAFELDGIGSDSDSGISRTISIRSNQITRYVPRRARSATGRGRCPTDDDVGSSCRPALVSVVVQSELERLWEMLAQRSKAMRWRMKIPSVIAAAVDPLGQYLGVTFCRAVSS